LLGFPKTLAGICELLDVLELLGFVWEIFHVLAIRLVDYLKQHYGLIFAFGAFSENVLSRIAGKGTRPNCKKLNAWILSIVQRVYPLPYQIRGNTNTPNACTHLPDLFLRASGLESWV